MTAILIPTYQVKNVSEQQISIKADPDLQSPIRPSASSVATIAPKTYIEIERLRVDDEQLNNLKRKNLIIVTSLQRYVTEGGTSTGSNG